MFDPLGYSNLLLPIGQAAHGCEVDFGTCFCGCQSGRAVSVTFTDIYGNTLSEQTACESEV